MNLIVLQETDFIDSTHVRLSDRRLEHIVKVHRAAPGQQLRVGLLNGEIGFGEIIALTDQQVELRVELQSNPPPPLPLTLILALPRPKMLKRIIQHITALGVKKLVLLNSYRVEKSYWQTPWLEPDKLSEQCLLGLEQAVDTQMPEIILRKRFKPFVEDELPELSADTVKMVAHPVGGRPARSISIRQPPWRLAPRVALFPTKWKNYKRPAFIPYTWEPVFCE
ncbi:ribosomal RNA small subunit methyltransferase E [Microbulbifer sp. GL-2]|nr:ribosomal RNA small subunit methyltransferase E [Microbulbifer sp. GL-2]